jgi:hypothetical protein
LPQFYGSIPGLFSDANANYHSLQLQAQKRFSNSYTLQAAYTWAKSIDDRSSTLIGGIGAQDPNNWGRAERALSDFNVAHILSINGMWDLPALSDRGILTSIAGGWRLSGIVRYNSGLPSTVYSGADNVLIGYSRTNGGAERADIVGDPNLSVSRSRQSLEAEYFNTAAFATPAPGQFGSVGRNTIVNLGQPNTTLTSPAFGKITSAGDPRIAQFALRYDF